MAKDKKVKPDAKPAKKKKTVKGKYKPTNAAMRSKARKKEASIDRPKYQKPAKVTVEPEYFKFSKDAIKSGTPEAKKQYAKLPAFIREALEASPNADNSINFIDGGHTLQTAFGIKPICEGDYIKKNESKILSIITESEYNKETKA